jgi:hypothetical protein
MINVYVVMMVEYFFNDLMGIDQRGIDKTIKIYHRMCQLKADYFLVTYKSMLYSSRRELSIARYCVRVRNSKEK